MPELAKLDSLVINSPISREPLKVFNKSLPPMGLGDICSEIRRSGKSVELVDAFSKNMSIGDIITQIQTKNPKFLLINIFSINKDIVYEIIRNTPDHIDIIIGGGTRGIDFSDLDIPNNVLIVDGEGEIIIPQIVNKGLSENFTHIIIGKNSPYYPQSISDIVLDHGFFHNDPQPNKLGFRESYLIYSRGCIYNCTFCGSSMKMKQVPRRIRNSQSLLAEIATIKKGVQHIRFLDDLLIDDSNDIDNICSVMEQSELSWSGMISILSVKKASDQELQRIKNSGCKELYFGLESGSEKTLKLFNKYSNIEDVIEQIKRVLSLGINAKVFLILGAYMEETEDLEATLNFAQKLSQLNLTGAIRFSPFMYKAYEGTELFNKIQTEAQKKGSQSKINNRINTETNDRSQFNMTNGNFSNCTEDEISFYINRILELNQ